MFKFIIIILITFNSAFAVEEVEEKYPFFRQFRSGFNLTFGAVSMVKSVQVLDDSESTNTELNYAYALTAIGALRLLDGFYYLFNESLPEIYLREGKLDPKSKKFQMHMEKARNFEKNLRYYRAGVIFVNGLGFFGLYNEDPEENKLSLYPGLGMLCVSAYAFFGKGPAEKAYERNFPEISFNPISIDNKIVWMPRLSFKF